jgi:hypothetical protein
LDTQGGDFFLLQSGGYIQLQQCGPYIPTWYIEVETNDGAIELQDGVDFIELESGP